MQLILIFILINRVNVDVTPFDQVIGPLAKSLARRADDILDLRRWALNRQHPGKCVDCFFRLFESADHSVAQQLQLLRKWLEDNIEIVARDEKASPLESLPLQIEENDLEALCRKFIRIIRNDRSYDSDSIVLEFRYKGAA